jgi:RNA recognition motif-containing protein
VNPDTFTQIHISKLDRKTGQTDVERQFSTFGKIRNLTMKLHYAFVDYENHEDAVEAIKKMNRSTFVNGEFLNV